MRATALFELGQFDSREAVGAAIALLSDPDPKVRSAAIGNLQTLSDEMLVEQRSRLLPLLDDPSATPREDALTKLGNGYSLRSERYRYTEWGPNGRDGNELYDHESDPTEMRNLANDPAHAFLVKKLSSRLHQRIAKAGEPPAGLKQTGKLTHRDGTE